MTATTVADEAKVIELLELVQWQLSPAIRSRRYTAGAMKSGAVLFLNEDLSCTHSKKNCLRRQGEL